MARDSMIVPDFILKGLADIKVDYATIGRVFAIAAENYMNITGFEKSTHPDCELDVACVVARMLEEYNADLDGDEEEK